MRSLAVKVQLTPLMAAWGQHRPGCTDVAPTTYRHSIEAHRSQNPAYWIELTRRQNAFYGHRCNREYAEGFRRLPLAMVHNIPAHDYVP